MMNASKIHMTVTRMHNAATMKAAMTVLVMKATQEMDSIVLVKMVIFV
jgi:hypothetical protein